MRIFFSYTLKDLELSLEMLQNLYRKYSVDNIVYIDALQSETNQLQVEKALISSDLLILIQTSDIDKSQWVQKEINLATSNNIPIVRKTYKELISL